MAGYSAFQSNGFQNNAFQIIASGGVAPVQQVYGTGWPHIWDYPANRQKALKDRVESLPEPVVEAIKQSVVIEDKTNRIKSLESKLKGVEFKFMRLYVTLLENYYQALLDDELARQLQEAERRREDDLIMLLLMSV